MRSTLALCLTFFAAIAFAGPAEDIAGTWECRQAGVAYGKTPPILYLGATEAKNAGAAAVVDVDGFARAVYGLADLTAGDGAWWKLTPRDGAPFYVRPDVARAGVAALQVRRGEGGVYRCLRIGRST